MKRIVCLFCALILFFGLIPETSAETETTTERWFGTTISAGDFHMSAIRNDGSLWVWGSNAYGALGIGEEPESLVPVRIMDDVSSTIAGNSGAYGAIKSNGELWNWGLHGNYGRLGRETKGRYLEPGKLTDHVLMADMGTGHSAALMDDGTLWMWGQNNYGELGNGRKGSLFTGEWADSIFEPLPFKAMTNIERVETGSHSTFAIDREHRLWAWGANDYAQLGIGKTGDAEVAVSKLFPNHKTKIQTKPILVMEDVAAVSAEDTTAILKTDGSLWICGKGCYTQDENYQLHHEPFKIMDDVVCAATSYEHFAAIKSDGSLWTWNNWGMLTSQLGMGKDDSAYQDNTPVEIMDHAVSVTAGWGFMAALKDDGSLWMWGDNSCGQLGNGTKEEAWTPVKVMDGVALPTGLNRGNAVSVDGAGSKGKHSSTGSKSKENRQSSSKGITCTIRFDPGKGTVKTRSKTGTFAMPYGTLPIPTLKGQAFTGWYTKPEGGDRITAHSVVITQEDHTLYAHWETSNGKPSVSELSYKFANSRSDFRYPDHYRIPYERYSRLFGDGYTAQRYYNWMGEWGGSCYGMCATASMLFCENGTEPNDFHKGAKQPAQLSLNDYSKELGMNLKEFIESAHILQITNTVSKMVRRNMNAYYSLVKAVQKFAKDGKDPVIISIKGPREADGSVPGHAVIGYAAGRIKKQNKDAIKIYDPNFPTDNNRYIELTWDKPGHYTGWHYRLNDSKNWGTAYGGDISYSQYSDVFATWNNIASEKPDGTTLKVNVDNATIYDYSGSLVAELKNGVMVTDRTDVYSVEVVNGPNGAPEDGYGTILRLPTDYYTIKNTDPDTKQLKMAMENGGQSVEISTTSDTVLCYANAENDADMVYINGKNEQYEVSFGSEREEQQGRATITGVTSEEVPTSFGKLSGTLYTTGVSLTGESRLEIDGKESTEDDIIPSSLIYMVSTSEPEAEETVFTDVPADSDYMPAIRWAYQNLIMDETELGVFSPENSCTAEETLDAVWRALGMPCTDDGEKQGNGSEAGRWAVDSGFDFRMDKEGACSTADLLLLLWQAEGEPGLEEEITKVENAVLWANDLRAVSDEMLQDGSADSTVLTRAELARILYVILSA